MPYPNSHLIHHSNPAIFARGVPSGILFLATLALLGCGENKKDKSESATSAKPVKAAEKPRFTGILTYSIASAISNDEYMSWSFQPWEDGIVTVETRLGNAPFVEDDGTHLWAGVDDKASKCIVYVAKNKNGQIRVSRMEGEIETFAAGKKSLCEEAAELLSQ